MSNDERAVGSSGEWAVFSKEDIESRWVRARLLMDQAGLDTLVGPAALLAFNNSTPGY